MQHEECLNNAIYRRSFVYEETGIQSREGKRIRDLLLTDERMNPFDFSLIGRLVYLLVYMGFFPILPLISLAISLCLYRSLLLLMIPFIRYVKTNGQILISFFLMLGYVLILAYFTHYDSYLKMNSLNIAMQGRYLLPIIPAAYLVMVWSLTKIRNKWFRKLILILLLVVFWGGSAFIFTKSIIHGGAEWYPNLFNSI